MAIQVMCGSCAKRFRAGDKLAGKKVKCPECKGVIQIPASQTVRVDQPAATPQPAHVAQSAPVAQSTSTYGATPMDAGGIGSLLDEEQVPVERRCPSCSHLLGALDVLCTGCGYDTRSKTKVQTRVEAKKAARKSPGLAKKAAAAGSATGAFARGIICSVVGALIGAAVWYGVAIATGFEIGWIAWGLGLAAGAGMQVGYGSNDDLAGIAAAFIACFGILAAKWMIFCHVVLPIIEQVEMAGGMGGQLPSRTSLFFQVSFGIIDGVFILLAFFTAYKVGAGKSSD